MDRTLYRAVLEIYSSIPPIIVFDREKTIWRLHAVFTVAPAALHAMRMSRVNMQGIVPQRALSLF